MPYFFDKTNPRAACKFTFTEPPDGDSAGQTLSHTVNVIEFDHESITCFAPPAYLFSNKLDQDGGVVSITASSNGVDFSDETAKPFDYLKPVVITQVHPPIILLGRNITVTLTGENYFDNSDTGLLLVRLTEELSNDKDPRKVIVLRDVFYNSAASAVTFDFPNDLYDDLDWVLIELTFDDVTWTLAQPNRIAVSRQIILTRTWPSHVYTNETDTEIYLQAGELNDAARGGDIWNMELYDNMQCKFFKEMLSNETQTDEQSTSD